MRLTEEGMGKRNIMREVIQVEKRSEALGRKLPAPLREFLDAVIVPALAREYRREETLAVNNTVVSNATVTASEVPR